MSEHIISRDDPRARRARPLVCVAPGTVVCAEAAAQIRQLALLEKDLYRRFESAYDDGMEAGIAEMTHSCAAILQRADADAARLVEGTMEESVRLALAIASRVLHAVVEAEPRRIKHLVEEVRGRYHTALTPVRLFAGTRAHHALERVGVENDETLILYQDPDADPWALRFESLGSVLHAGIEHQLRAVEHAIRGAQKKVETEG